MIEPAVRPVDLTRRGQVKADWLRGGGARRKRSGPNVVGGAGGHPVPEARLASLFARAPVPPLADYPPPARAGSGDSGVPRPPPMVHREAVAEARRRARAAAPAIVARALARHAGRRVTMVGFLTTTKRVRTKHDEPMMFLTLEDETDIYDVVLFPRVYQRYGARLGDRGPYVITGTVEDDPRPSVMAERIVRLEESCPQSTRVIACRAWSGLGNRLVCVNRMKICDMKPRELTIRSLILVALINDGLHGGKRLPRLRVGSFASSFPRP